MAFPQLVPASGTIHTENDQDFIAYLGKWYKRPTVEVRSEGGSDLGSRGSNVFKNRTNTTIGRLFGARAAKHYIKLQGAFSVSATNANVGISFYRNGAWEDFSAKNVNFNNASGFTNWGHGGAQGRDWYDQQHFTTHIWLGDPRDRARLPAKGKPAYFTVHIMQTHGTQTIMVWELKHQGSTDEVMISTGSVVIGGAILKIEYINLTVDGSGTFTDGRMTVEWW